MTVGMKRRRRCRVCCVLFLCDEASSFPLGEPPRGKYIMVWKLVKWRVGVRGEFVDGGAAEWGQVSHVRLSW